MHREIALHMRGMWIAFSLTALIVAILVTRLVVVVEQRDRALERLRERTARSTRAAGLATLAAGAAHELSTPLSTIAVTARELERNLAAQQSNLQADAQLIRAETDRCREVLEAMAVRSGEPAGETPRASTLADVLAALRERLTPAEWNRIDVDLPDQLAVVWPIRVVVRALDNVVQNALQASPASSQVRVSGGVRDGLVALQIVDEGTGMSPDQLSRAGEPFFTTKPAGKGTGLGLFVARSSIEQLGGTLALAASAGRGTTASIVLPANVLTAEPERRA
jgi:two-component system sensor histidine kinase RegB